MNAREAYEAAYKIRSDALQLRDGLVVGLTTVSVDQLRDCGKRIAEKMVPVCEGLHRVMVLQERYQKLQRTPHNPAVQWAYNQALIHVLEGVRPEIPS